MSLKTRMVSLTTCAVAIAAISTISYGQNPTTEKAVTPGDKVEKHGMKRGGFGRHGRMAGHGGGFHGLRSLNLTDAQKAQIKAIREANKPDEAIIAEMKAIRDARRAGTELTEAQKDRIKAIREQRAAKAKSVHDQIMNVLTVEQKAELEKRRTEMRQRREQFRQKREEFRKNRPAKPARPDTTKIS